MLATLAKTKGKTLEGNYKRKTEELMKRQEKWGEMDRGQPFDDNGASILSRTIQRCRQAKCEKQWGSKNFENRGPLGGGGKPLILGGNQLGECHGLAERFERSATAWGIGRAVKIRSGQMCGRSLWLLSLVDDGVPPIRDRRGIPCSLPNSRKGGVS